MPELRQLRQRLLRVLGLSALALVLAGVFCLYLRPDFMVQISTQLWSCF